MSRPQLVLMIMICLRAWILLCFHSWQLVHSICFTGSVGCCLRKFFRSPSHFFRSPGENLPWSSQGLVWGGCEVNYGNLAEGPGSGQAILHETLTWSNIKETVDIKRLAEWSGHDCERILFTVKKLILGVSMQVLEQNISIAEHCLRVLQLYLNKTKCTNQENAICIWKGGGCWIWPHWNMLSFFGLKTKHN